MVPPTQPHTRQPGLTRLRYGPPGPRVYVALQRTTRITYWIDIN